MKSSAGVASGKGHKPLQKCGSDKSNAKYPGYKKMEYPTPEVKSQKV